MEILQAINRLIIELSRAGNNLNQLSRYPSRVKNKDGLNYDMVLNLNLLLSNYLKNMDDLKSIVKLIYRELGKR